MRFQPKRAKRIGSAVNRVNLSATLFNQSSFNGKLNRNKNKWSKDASLQIGFFLLKTKKNVKSSHLSIKNRLDVYVFEM